MGEHNSSIKVYISAFLAMLFWGLSFIWTSIVLEYYTPIPTIFLRLVISASFLLLVLRLWGRLQKIKREHFWLFLLSATFNPFLYFIGENYGLLHTSPSVTAIIIATIPLFTPLAARYMVRERLSWYNFLGIVISFAGIMLMLLKPDLTFIVSPKGILFLALAVFSAVIYSVLLKKLTVHYNAASIIAWQNLLGVFLFLPLLTGWESMAFIDVVPDTRCIISLVSLAIFASSLAFILFTYTIGKIGVSRANVYSNLIPVVTAIASYFLLGEEFPAGKIAGIIIVLSGVMITQIKKKQYKHG